MSGNQQRVPGLSMWTVYDHPCDHPDKFVARRWTVTGDNKMSYSDQLLLADTLEEIRALIPQGLYRLRRFDEDDRCIVEVWL